MNFDGGVIDRWENNLEVDDASIASILYLY